MATPIMARELPKRVYNAVDSKGYQGIRLSVVLAHGNLEECTAEERTHSAIDPPFSPRRPRLLARSPRRTICIQLMATVRSRRRRCHPHIQPLSP